MVKLDGFTLRTNYPWNQKIRQSCDELQTAGTFNQLGPNHKINFSMLSQHSAQQPAVDADLPLLTLNEKVAMLLEVRRTAMTPT